MPSSGSASRIRGIAMIYDKNAVRNPLITEAVHRKNGTGQAETLAAHARLIVAKDRPKCAAVSAMLAALAARQEAISAGS